MQDEQPKADQQGGLAAGKRDGSLSRSQSWLLRSFLLGILVSTWLKMKSVEAFHAVVVSGTRLSTNGTQDLMKLLHQLGWTLFSLAVSALAVETVVCARFVADSLGFGYRVIPVIPRLPAVPFLAYLCGVVLGTCGFVLLWGTGLFGAGASADAAREQSRVALPQVDSDGRGGCGKEEEV
jgi:hypothetical protein